MSHTIVTYCSSGFLPCLQKSLPTWLSCGLAVKVFTDDKNATMDAIGLPDDDVLVLTDDKSDKKRESCTRKILTIQKAIEMRLAERITWLDSDCFVLKDFTKIYTTIQADLLVTRMVIRHRKINTVNAGVSFWRANEATKNFCHTWLKNATCKYASVNLHEQEAFNDLAYYAFDTGFPCSVAPISERKYNLEHENNETLKKEIFKYEPYIVHLKGGRWKNYDYFFEQPEKESV
jgi:hypothetical protein